MRLRRPQFENCCVHVTHRCQERRFLLRFEVDRRRYQQRLFEASRRFAQVRLLNYVVTSNHVHLLAWTPRMCDLSEMLHWLHGTMAQDCNRRQQREGSFWRGRFHPTLVQTGNHLSRCLFYLDMNMVRAGAVQHPEQWACGGYHELCGQRQRYRIVHEPTLLRCLGMASEEGEQFRSWYTATLAAECRKTEWPREPFWSSAMAVGDRRWLTSLTRGDAEAQDYIQPIESAASEFETAPDASCVLQPPQSVYLRIWDRLSKYVKTQKQP